MVETGLYSIRKLSQEQRLTLLKWMIFVLGLAILPPLFTYLELLRLHQDSLTQSQSLP